jgi:hypothetical protein
MEAVIDLNGRMEDFSDPWAFRDGCSDSRKILEKVNMVQKASAKAFGG